MGGMDVHIDKFNIQEVTSFLDDYIRLEGIPNIIYIYGKSDLDTFNVSKIVKNNICHTIVDTDFSFSCVDDFKDYIKYVSEQGVTIINSFELDTFKCLSDIEKQICKFDLLEGVCRCLGLRKLVLNVVDDANVTKIERHEFGENHFILNSKLYI